MGSAGFEPAKALPSDLQSDPFDRSGNSPSHMFWKLRAVFRRFKKLWPTCCSPLGQSIFLVFISFIRHKFHSTSPDSSPVRPAGKASARIGDIRTRQFFMIELRWTVFHPAASWASGGTWTRNLLITNQPLCQLSYASGPSGPRTEQVYGFIGDVQDEGGKT